MKTIGFIDYYVSEWHANNYPAWIREASSELSEEIRVGYVWAELDVSPVDGVTTDQWCERFGVERCSSIKELCERSDYICILAPTNPERHFDYAAEAFKCGKRTYVDKTFAPDLATAKAIFNLGEKYNTPFFSTSALRYAPELCAAAGARKLKTTGGGSNLEEYIIHQAEMLVRVLGPSPKKVRAEEIDGGTCRIFVEFADGKEGEITYCPTLPFTVSYGCGDSMSEEIKITSEYFKSLIRDILVFYTTGKRSFDSKETLAVAALREAVIKAKNNVGTIYEL